MVNVSFQIRADNSVYGGERKHRSLNTINALRENDILIEAASSRLQLCFCFDFSNAQGKEKRNMIVSRCNYIIQEGPAGSHHIPPGCDPV